MSENGMTVRELIEELSKCDPESLVILQKDSEGNGYSPCSGADPNNVYVDDRYECCVYKAKLTPEDEKAGYTDEDLCPEDVESVPCVVLWPW